MQTKLSREYITHLDWLRDSINEDVILCYGSALEYLQMFLGYANEIEIDVFALNSGKYENINYHIVKSFDDIDCLTDGNIRCTTFNQTVNDMLSNWDNMDDTALAHSLSNYYHKNGNSFVGLRINPMLKERFEYMKEWAIEFHSEF